MAEFKLVLNDTKTGKAHQREVKDEEANFLIGKKIGDKVSGDGFGLAGYEFQVTGGSDRSGFPMRKDLDLDGKKKILIVGGVGLKTKRKGMRIRKTVAGNTVGVDTVQINLKVLKFGKEKLGGEDAPAEDAAPTEEKKE